MHVMIQDTVKLSAKLLQGGLASDRAKSIVSEVRLADVLRHYRDIRFAQLTIRCGSRTPEQCFDETRLEIERG